MLKTNAPKGKQRACRSENIYLAARYGYSIAFGIASLVILALSICVSVIAGNTLLFWIFIPFVIVLVLLCVFSWARAIRFRRDCEHCKQHGVYRYAIVVLYKRKQMPFRSGSFAYKFLVEYYSHRKNQFIQFWTPYARLDVSDFGNLKCTVYEWGEKSYAENFVLLQSGDLKWR